MTRKLVGCFVGLALMMTTGTASASIIWTVSGQIGDLATGVDDEQLAGASLTLSITVDPGV